MLTLLLLATAAGPDDPGGPSPPPPAPPAPAVSVLDPVAPPSPAPTSVLDLPAGRGELLQLTGYAGKAKVRWRANGPYVVVTPLKPKTQVWFTGPTPPVRLSVVGGGPSLELVFGLKAGATAPSKHAVGVDPAVLLTPAGAGEVTVEADGSNPDGEIVTLLSVRVRAGAGPQPPPTPDPPGPTPADPSPFPDPGFRVLFVYDAANTTRPAAQNGVLFGAAVRDYLKRKCVVEGDNGDPATAGRGFRIYTANADVSQAPKVWADAFRLATAKGKDWILIGDGRRGYSGPLPATEQEAMALLQKYGGP